MVFLYVIVCGVSLLLSYVLRFDGRIPNEMFEQMLAILPWLVTVQVLFLIILGQMSVLPAYFGIIDFKAHFLSISGSGIGLMLVLVWNGIHLPRSIWVLDYILVLVGLSGSRMALRILGEWQRANLARVASYGDGVVKPVAIIGAGSLAAGLIREISNKPGLRLKAVALFDDDPSKWNQRLHGVPVVGAPEMLVDEPWRSCIRKVIIAMPSANFIRLSEVAKIASSIGVVSETIPNLCQLVSGVVRLSQVRPVQIEDLLRRSTILIDSAEVKTLIRNRVVAVTGAGGSIGSELCRQILDRSPKILLLIDHSEVQLFQIEQECVGKAGSNIVVPLVADVCSEYRIRNIFEQYRPEVVFHAAAYKHVPLMESQPFEAIRNNCFGTINIIRIAYEYSVDRFVMVSTDKAINPTNIMGASKRLAELYLQSFGAAHPRGTRFMAVRFGNVLGSSGSVVPTFQKQIALGGPVTVTHPEMTRYFMTIPEAVGLVLEAGSLGEVGEIFVLDMGQPVKIIDLARKMIELSGYRPGEDIEIRFIGLRPGEKMFEELSHQKEILLDTSHPKIFKFASEAMSLDTVNQHIDNLKLNMKNKTAGEVKRMVKTIVPEYEASFCD